MATLILHDIKVVLPQNIYIWTRHNSRFEAIASSKELAILQILEIKYHQDYITNDKYKLDFDKLKNYLETVEPETGNAKGLGFVKLSNEQAYCWLELQKRNRLLNSPNITNEIMVECKKIEENIIEIVKCVIQVNKLMNLIQPTWIDLLAQDLPIIKNLK